MENYNEKIAMLLKKVGVTPAHLGWEYITEAVKMVIEDKGMRYCNITRLYSVIARKHFVTAGSVERAIRHAIEGAFDKMPTDIRNAIFGNAVSRHTGKATNGEFITTLAEIITTEPNNPIWSM